MVESFRPQSYDEALEILSREEVIIVAGGTDVMVRRRQWSQLTPAYDKSVMFLAGLEELNYIDRQGSNVHIGAGVSLEDIMDHFHTPELLIDAIELIGSPAIRHSATLIGNVVNASPAGDTLPILYLLDGVVVLESINGLRHVPIESFIVGPGKTSIKSDELVKEVVLHDHSFNHSSYRKVGGRQADAISKISFVGACHIKKHIIEDFRMAFGAVGPTVVRDKAIEASIVGKTSQWLKDNRERLIDQYMEQINPIDDQRSTADYRNKIGHNLMKDFMHIG